MTEAEFAALKPGDRVRAYGAVWEVVGDRPSHKNNRLSYKSNYGKDMRVLDVGTCSWARTGQHGWDTVTSAEKYSLIEYRATVPQAHYTFDGIPGEQEAAHYRVEGVPEAWEVIEALQSSWPPDVRYCLANVVKYVFRLGRKQGASVESDLEKIRNYADRAIKVLGKAK